MWGNFLYPKCLGIQCQNLALGGVPVYLENCEKDFVWTQHAQIMRHGKFFFQEKIRVGDVINEDEVFERLEKIWL